MTKAAGILIIAANGQALFLKRGNGGDHANEWCFPGGHAEYGETAEETAIRETAEETGYVAESVGQAFTRTISAAPAQSPGVGSVDAPPTLPDPIDFTTFLVRVNEPFVPTLCPEHTGYAWASVDQPPEPLHPGCAIALRRLDMNELDIARAIAAGELTSPQRYMNVLLQDIRITGTGVSYRSAHKEFVLRKPEIYLNEEFVARCNGLSVIFEHPEKATLNSKEFQDRVVGSIMLPYIKGNEVWGIAKIYDDDAVALLSNPDTTRMSTSPSVVLKPGDSTKLKLESGETLLIEGEAALLDHIALLVGPGVWDKGGPLAGVNSQGDKQVTEEEKKAAAEKEREDKARKDAEEKETKEREEKAKADAEAGTKLDMILSKLDSAHKRMDAMEECMADKKRKDAEESETEEEKKKREEKERADKKRKDEETDKIAADKSKKDAEEKEEKERADRAKADAEVAARIADMEKRMPKQLADADYTAMTDAQARADEVYQAFGTSAPRFMNGETPGEYRRRLANGLKQHSTRWKSVDLNAAFADDAAFKNAENDILHDAMEAAKSPADIPEDQLRAVVRKDSAGREITTFYGQPRAWMSAFGGNTQALRRIVKDPTAEDRG